LADILYNRNEYQEALTRYAQLERLASEKSSRITALTGILRCQYYLDKDKDVIASAGKLLAEKNLDANLSREARYYRAKGNLNTNKTDQAKADLTILSSEVQTIYGAESRFLLAELYFKQNNLKESEKTINTFIQEGTPHSYWLAHSFILLADIHMQRKDNFQAKQYLLSLKENYKADDDIAGLIEARLNKIALLNN
jgi:TolA-binding protein